ncbi:hypothetical protein C8A01DRAFT_35825 [Parachaetomium inaequale]|uniref:Uncharacterized protein n=1 Tax=Parachaetomium inaequale TaxID=2588326 RepID=A0AAN6PHF5_9PEZI|nr:hypothetical protein C8A01DRAFT_35825 [Parachaetomium inaequale]
MPTVNEPKLQAPMEAANPAQLQQPGEPGGKAVVATQPRSEPRPTMENENDLALRGGRMNLGFSFCDGRCHCRVC